MLTRLSAKGQLVVPKRIRKALGLQPGTPLNMEIKRGKIVLQPIVSSPIDLLYGKYRDADFLTELETEHQREVLSEKTVRA